MNVLLILSFVFQVENVKAILEVEVSQLEFVILGTYFLFFEYSHLAMLEVQLVVYRHPGYLKCLTGGCRLEFI